MQLRRFNMKLFLVLAFSLFAFSARAERPADANLYQYIVGAGPMGFTPGGAALLPGSIIGGMKAGQVSPIMQFVLLNNMVTKCVDKVQKQFPYRRDPFVVANSKFNQGYCQIRKCFEQAMLVALLPQLSANNATGGSDDSGIRQNSQMMGMVLSQAFQKESSCSQGSAAIDPALVSAMGK